MEIGLLETLLSDSGLSILRLSIAIYCFFHLSLCRCDGHYEFVCDRK